MSLFIVIDLRARARRWRCGLEQAACFGRRVRDARAKRVILRGASAIDLDASGGLTRDS